MINKLKNIIIRMNKYKIKFICWKMKRLNVKLLKLHKKNFILEWEKLAFENPSANRETNILAPLSMDVLKSTTKQE